MKVGFIADVHLHNYKLGAGKVRGGTNARARLTAKCLHKAANNYGLDQLWILGDLFDTANPSPQLVSLCMEALKGDCWVFILRGNHDMVSTEIGDNALAPLKHLSNVTVVEELQVFDEELVVAAFPFPYIPTEHTVDVAVDVAVMHRGISEPDTPSFLNGGILHTQLRTWMDSQRVSVPLLFAGDWHEHRKFCNGRINQVGVFTPKSKSDALPGVGQMAIVDTNKSRRVVSGVEVPHVKWVEVAGPRFAEAVSKSAAVEMATALLEAGHRPFISYPADAASPADKDLDEPKGSVIRADAAKPVHVDALEAGDALRARAALMDKGQLLKAYLKHKHPESWKRMLKVISAEM